MKINIHTLNFATINDNKSIVVTNPEEKIIATIPCDLLVDCSGGKRAVVEVDELLDKYSAVVQKYEFLLDSSESKHRATKPQKK